VALPDFPKPLCQGTRLDNWTHFRGLATPTEVLPSRTLTKLLSKAPETALVNHVVKWHLLREQSRRLNTKVKPLDVDLAVGAIAGNDQKAEPVDMALERPIAEFNQLFDAEIAEAN
jgi:hypothetical protein